MPKRMMEPPPDARYRAQEDIDLERVVYDPEYRARVRDQLNREASEGPSAKRARPQSPRLGTVLAWRRRRTGNPVKKSGIAADCLHGHDAGHGIAV